MVLQDGEIVGPYRITSQLGQGGMATVYKAFHPQLERYVAIKILHQSFQEDPNFTERFQREAKIVASLDHPNIVPIFDFSEYKGQPYLVMKLIEGDTLKYVMTDGDSPLNDILDMLTEVAAALTYAHQRGILHRDIKPSNILIDANQRPYITDFGLARMVQTGQSTYSQDMLMGTPYYISPEQAKGSLELGPGVDIYSLGVILYELATGRVPFSGTTPYAIVHDHIYTPLPLPSTINPEVSPQVEQVLLKALAKEPSDRYQSAVEMVNAYKVALRKSGKANPLGIALPAANKLQRKPAAQPIALPASQRTNPKSSNLKWLIPVFAATAILIIGLVLLRASRKSPEANLPLPTLISLVPTLTPAASSEISLYTVPDLTVQQAQDAVQQNPNDPVAYLALANTLLLQGDTDNADTALSNGLKVASDSVAYLLTAAALSDQADKSNIAAYLYSAALAKAEENPVLFPLVRDQVGAYLYNLALQPRETSIDQVRSGDGAGKSPTTAAIVSIMVIRGLITQNRLLLADTALRRLSADEANLPEALLVQGELFQAQGKANRAQSDWKAAKKASDAPAWLQVRVDELLQSP